MKNFTAVAACLVFGAAGLMGASAQTSGVYAGGGYSHFDGDNAVVGGLTGRLGVDFGRYWGLEGEVSFGINDDDVSIGTTTGTVELDNAFGVFGVGKLPVSDRFDLFGRVGWAQAEVKGSVAGLTASADDNGLAYGVGGNFWLTPVDGLRGEVTRFDFDDNSELDVWSASYIRRF
ncbi:outer membrane beta-barrel protein [bacterium]|nr:outer membrane beta-barrel protein [bacterium]